MTLFLFPLTYIYGLNQCIKGRKVTLARKNKFAKPTGQSYVVTTFVKVVEVRKSLIAKSKSTWTHFVL